MDYNHFIIRILSTFFLLIIFFYIYLFNDYFFRPLFFIIYLIIFYEIYKNFINRKLILLLYLYIVFSFLCLEIYLYYFYNSEIFLFLFIIIIIFDTFCYLFGTLFGEKKIFKKISPNKTFAGLYLGIFFTLLFSIILNQIFEIFDLITGFIFIIMIILLSFIGDIIESIFKRISGLKNSSNLIPGHGGFFDRFDSFILCTYGLILFSYVTN